MNQLSFDLLKTLIAVAESKNFNEAASKLKISQPAVSFQLKELESQLPLALFQLEGKRKVLTHYGRSLYKIAKNQSLHLENQIEDLHRVYAHPELLTLRVGGRSEVLEFIGPQLNFLGKIELINLNSSEAIEKLVTHKLDIAISYVLPDSTEIVAKKLFQSSSQFIVHEKFLRNKKLTLDLAKNKDFLTQNPCIIYHRDGHMLKDWLKHIDIPLENLKIRFVAEDWRTVQRLVDQGLGYAIVPAYIKNDHIKTKFLDLPSHAMPPYTFYALYEKGLKKIEAFNEVLKFERLL